MTHEEKLIHVTRTCRFITNRGVSHELVIKRNNWSFSQESTRYVRYNGDMKFIKPVWWKEDPETDADVNAQHFWRSHMFDSEKRYGYLLNEGWRSEQARDILPLSLASEIVCTAPLKEWWHMLGLRTSKAAHPQIRALMQPVLAELEKELPFF
jgi:thymidylate synthase (FAD)